MRKRLEGKFTWNTQDDFYKKMETQGDCWIWKNSKTPAGYGKFMYRKKHWLTHRLSYYFANGEIPLGMQVLHRCDNPSCINPNHLFLGTQAMNMKDMVAKNRSLKGTKHPSAKLTEEQVRMIRTEWGGRVKSVEAISEQYGFSKSGICGIIHNRNWKHLLTSEATR